MLQLIKPSTTMAKLEQDNRKIVEQRQIISTFRSITDKAFRDQTIKDVSRVRAHLKSSCFWWESTGSLCPLLPLLGWRLEWASMRRHREGADASVPSGRAILLVQVPGVIPLFSDRFPHIFNLCQHLHIHKASCGRLVKFRPTCHSKLFLLGRAL